MPRSFTKEPNIAFLVSYAKFCHVFCSNLQNGFAANAHSVLFLTAIASQCENCCERAHRKWVAHVIRAFMNVWCLMNEVGDRRDTKRSNVDTEWRTQNAIRSAPTTAVNGNSVLAVTEKHKLSHVMQGFIHVTPTNSAWFFRSRSSDTHSRSRSVSGAFVIDIFYFPNC